MAAPHVAGAMGLLRAMHPTWSVEDLKALVMNTAVHDLRSGTGEGSVPAGPAWAGAGRIDLQAALRSEVVAHASEPQGGVSVSFGLVEVEESVELRRTVEVVNHGGQAVDFEVVIVPTVDSAGVELSLAGASAVTVPAGSSSVIEVVLTAEAGLVELGRGPSAAGFPPLLGGGGGTVPGPFLARRGGGPGCDQPAVS